MDVLHQIPLSNPDGWTGMDVITISSPLQSDRHQSDRHQSHQSLGSRRMSRKLLLAQLKFVQSVVPQRLSAILHRFSNVFRRVGRAPRPRETRPAHASQGPSCGPGRFRSENDAPPGSDPIVPFRRIPRVTNSQTIFPHSFPQSIAFPAVNSRAAEWSPVRYKQ